MEPRLKPVVALAAVAILAVALTTCSNPIDFVEEVTDAVMVANDKYLEVTGVLPVKNELNYSPDDLIKIDFDRDIDLATVTTTTVVFSPAIEFSETSFSARTLTITPATLAEEADYTVTVTTGVKGLDGSAPRQDYTWNFHTGTAPSGSVKVNSDATYTNNASVTLNITSNGIVTHMRYAQSLVALSGTPYTPVAASVVAYGLTGADGVNTIYIQFRDSAVPSFNESTIKSDTIILDRDAPDVDAGATQTLNIAGSSKTLNATASDDTAGIASYSWTKFAGPGTVTLGTAASEDTTISAGTDGTYTMRLTVTDHAGNSGYDDVTVYRDLTAPTISSAGGTQYLRRLAQTSSIAATTSDAIGIASWLWEKTAGPGTLSFGTPSAEDTTVSGSADGTYTARLTVTDLRGNSSQASITIYRDIVDPVITMGSFPTYLNIAASSYATTTTVTDVNTCTYAWTDTIGTGDVTFSSSAVMNPTIYAATDGTRTVTLTATDLVGNTASANSTSMTIDRVAPSAPTVSGPASPFAGNAPTYTWATGGGGAGYFHYMLDTDSGYGADTNAVTLTPTVSYGRRYFYVQERDAAGNWSSSNYKYLWVYPTWIMPLQYETVDRSPTVKWASSFSTAYYYDVFYKRSTDSTWTQLMNDTNSISYSSLPAGTLASSAIYYWYYTRRFLSITTRYPSGSDYFTFYTSTTP
jgi:large repetitive protein